jgi:hypothetical protein
VIKPFAVTTNPGKNISGVMKEAIKSLQGSAHKLVDRGKKKS